MRSSLLAAPVLLGLGAVATPSGTCGNSTGLVPLNDLGGGTHGGFEGGLYPGGAVVPPPAHAAAALAEAAAIVPRDASGAPDAGCGLIGVIGVGMSNAAHEFAAFERQADADGTHAARVVLLNGAQGGQTAAVLADPAAPYWQLLLGRVAALGLTPEQVQVAWLKEADAGPPNDFPGHALVLQAELVDVVRNLRGLFPNLRLAYVSSRTYGGYAQGPLNPEPQAYESGFAFKWLLEQQIQGDPLLSWDAAAGPVEAPLLLWGPYLWADGEQPRSDGLTWCTADFEGDGTHPSAAGEQKVADPLAAFLATEPSAQAWYSPAGAPPVTLDAEADAHVDSTAPTTAFGSSPRLETSAGAQTRTIYLRFDVSRVPRPVQLAKLDLRVPTDTQAHPRDVWVVPDSTWDEASVTFASAPALGALLRSIPQASRDGSIAADVAQAVNEDVDGLVTLAVTAAGGGVHALVSREGGDPPRLVLVPGPGDVSTYCTGKTSSLGCVPFVATAGAPSASATGPFQVRAHDLLPGEAGFLLYGTSGKASLAFHGGVLCVKAPLTRLLPAKLAKTAGPPPCSGALSVNFNARIQAGSDPRLTPGARVHGQWRQRDPADPAGFGDSLTDGVRFSICP